MCWSMLKPAAEAGARAYAGAFPEGEASCAAGSHHKHSLGGAWATSIIRNGGSKTCSTCDGLYTCACLGATNNAGVATCTAHPWQLGCGMPSGLQRPGPVAGHNWMDCSTSPATGAGWKRRWSTPEAPHVSLKLPGLGVKCTQALSATRAAQISGAQALQRSA